MSILTGRTSRDPGYHQPSRFYAARLPPSQTKRTIQSCDGRSGQAAIPPSPELDHGICRPFPLKDDSMTGRCIIGHDKGSTHWSGDAAHVAAHTRQLAPLAALDPASMHRDPPPAQDAIISASDQKQEVSSIHEYNILMLRGSYIMIVLPLLVP